MSAAISEPAAARSAATEIVRTLRGAGHVAYFAGGCVRDELLGLTPTDYDIATDAEPRRLAEVFARTRGVGEHFGVMLVRVHGVDVEVATFRCDGAYTDRRRPDAVRFAGEIEDARRRDFTINALLLDPLEQGEEAGVRGRVIDHVGGRADLAARIVRAVGDPDQRLREDHLRGLRGVRFAARLGFGLESQTAAAIARQARELQGVSRERVGEEVRRMLVHATRGSAARMLEELGLDEHVLGDGHMVSGAGRIAAIRAPHMTRGAVMDLGVQSRAAAAAEGASPAERLASEDVPRVSFAMALAAWMMDRHGEDAITEASIARTRSALCLSNEETSALRAIGRQRAALPRKFLEASIAKSKRQAATPGFVEAMGVLAVSNAADAAEIWARVADISGVGGGIAPWPLLTGDDLVALGKRPGPRFKRVLEAVYDAQLEGRTTTKNEALELSRTLGV